MNTEKIKQQIKELDKNNIITDLVVIARKEMLHITADTFECYCYFNFDYIELCLMNNVVYNEEYKVNNIKIMRNTLDFLENNIDKIKAIIKNNLQG